MKFIPHVFHWDSNWNGDDRNKYDDITRKEERGVGVRKTEKSKLVFVEQLILISVVASVVLYFLLHSTRHLIRWIFIRNRAVWSIAFFRLKFSVHNNQQRGKNIMWDMSKNKHIDFTHISTDRIERKKYMNRTEMRNEEKSISYNVKFLISSITIFSKSILHLLCYNEIAWMFTILIWTTRREKT